jgi:large subunit ribosomal protein L31
MKDGIHPKYMDTKITCGCGNSFTTRGTKPELRVDICNACHPFYTGKLKYVDAAGRIERFRTKFGATGYGGVTRAKEVAKEVKEKDEGVTE